MYKLMLSSSPSSKIEEDSTSTTCPIPFLITPEKVISSSEDTITTLSTEISEIGLRDISSFDITQGAEESENVESLASIENFRVLPTHMIRSGQVAQAANILTNSNFIKNRIKYVGVDDGAVLHVADCERLQRKILKLQKQHKEEYAFTCSDSNSSAALSNGAENFDSMSPQLTSAEGEKHPTPTTWKDSHEIPYMPSDVASTYCSTSQTNSNSSGDLNNEICPSLSVDKLDINDITVKAFKKYKKYIWRMVKETCQEDNEVDLEILRQVEMALFEFGSSLHNREWNSEAMTMFRRCLSVRIRIQKKKIPAEEDQIAMARVLIKIGDIEGSRRTLSKALTNYQESLTCLKFNSDDHESKVESARIYNRIGDIHGCKNDLELALDSYQDALKIQKRELGDSHVSVAETLHNIGVVHRHTGELNLALESYQEALGILQEKEEETLDIARTFNNIGSIYRRKGEYNTALSFFVDALKVRRKLQGDYHDSVNLTLIHCAKALRHQGDMEEAMKFYDECMK